MATLNRTSWKNLYGLLGTIFPDNTTSEISESDMRTFGENLADSFLNKSNDLIDDDTFATASATTVPSSESVKAYVDAQTAGVGEVNNTDVKFFEQWEWFTSSGFNDYSSHFNGAGAANTLSTYGVNTTENALGVLKSETGTTNAGRAGIFKSNDQVIFGSGFTYTFQFRQAIETLSDGTDTFTVYLGFFNNVSTSGDCVNGVYFRYTHGTNSGKWQAVTRAASVETAEDTTVAVDAGPFHTFKIVINANGSQVDFYIDGVKTNDITTNIPTGANLTSFGFKIEKSAGTTSRSMYQDYYDLLITRTTVR